jgi:hypothetical protein
MIPKVSDTSDVLKRIDLATALQYGTAAGYPPLHSFIRQFVRENLHPNVPYAGGPETILTCGATDGFSKVVEAFANTWNEERDWIREREGILCEEFAYMNAIQTVTPRGINVVPVAMDTEGMMVAGKGGLANVLENWDFSRGKRPHLMYTVTLVNPALLTDFLSCLLTNHKFSQNRPESFWRSSAVGKTPGDLRTLPEVRYYYRRRRPILAFTVSFRETAISPIPGD